MDLFTPLGLVEDPDRPTALDRRVFVKGLGLVGMGLLTSTLGGCEYLADAIKNRPVRRRLRTGSPEVDADIATYREAVAAMKALPASDPRSWAAQAEMPRHRRRRVQLLRARNPVSLLQLAHRA